MVTEDGAPLVDDDDVSEEPICCVCLMPMRGEKPAHFMGKHAEHPMHKDCVGPSIIGVRKA